MIKYRYILTILFVSIFSIPVLGQNRSSIKVTLLDTLSKEPVSFATIYLSKDGTTENSIYSTTNDKGEGILERVPQGKYIFTAEMMGYITKKIDIKVKEGVNDLGTIYMSEDVTTLEQVVVTAVGNPIVVKKDTIEYSAASFKTTENDVLEDLLKKRLHFILMI